MTTRNFEAWAFALALGSITGCYEGLDPLHSDFELRESCSARPPTDGSIVVHYGARKEKNPSDGFFAAIDGQGEHVIVTRAIAPTCEGTFARWRNRSWHNRWAYKMTADLLAETLMCGQFVDFVQARIDEGWDYVAIDEIRTKPDANLDTSPPHTCEAYKAHLAQKKRHHDWRNGARLSNLWISGLQTLADEGYDRRVLPYFSSSVVSSQARSNSLRNVLKASRDHARVNLVELYRHTSAQHTVAEHRNYFDGKATHLENAAPGINDRTAVVLGVSNTGGAMFMDQSASDLSSLQDQFAALHQGDVTRRHPGVGAYSWGATVDTSHYTSRTLARRFRDLSNWYAHHFGTAPAPPDPASPSQEEPMCNEPHEKDVDGVCIPSCGVAGGNACVPASSDWCDGHPQFESYDCEICCAVPSYVDIHRGWNANLRTHKYARSAMQVSEDGYAHEGPVFQVAVEPNETLIELHQCTKANGKPLYTTDPGCEGTGHRSATLGFIGSAPMPDMRPLHRLYKSANGAHFYAATEDERQVAESIGYVYEGVQGWVW